MATKSPKSPGSQFTAKGVIQGNALVSPVDGLPVNVIIDGAGVHRLAVDADLTADNITVDTRDLTPETDTVQIGDSNTSAHVKVNVDGSIDANITTSAFVANPDSELVVGTEDGTITGTPHVLQVDSNKNLHVINMGQLIPEVFDSISAAYPTATQELYTYYSGGLSGTAVAILTVNYTDSSKNFIANVSRT